MTDGDPKLHFGFCALQVHPALTAQLFYSTYLRFVYFIDCYSERHKTAAEHVCSSSVQMVSNAVINFFFFFAL